MTKNDERNRKILHRVVFYDLLSTPSIDHQKDTYGRIHEAHLSIPLIPGLETVWAPNGYGKTFAMQMLERMWKPVRWSSESHGPTVWWFDDFLSECQGMIKNVSETLSSEQIRDYNFLQTKDERNLEWHPQGGIQRMRPFSIMMARIVELDSDGRINSIDDLWIKPKWKDYLGMDIETGINVIDHTNRMRKKGSLEHIRNHCSNDSELCELLISWGGLSKRENQLVQSLDNSLKSDEDYLTPIIPKTFDFEGKEWSGSVYDKKTDEWIKGKSTWERLPPEQNQYLEVGNTMQSGYMSGPETIHVDLLDVLRTTKVDYLEIPKTSMEFFADEATAEKNVVGFLSKLRDIGLSNPAGIDPFGYMFAISDIEEKINQVLEMKGELDPWSRKIVLYPHGTKDTGIARSNWVNYDNFGSRFYVPYSNSELKNFREIEEKRKRDVEADIDLWLTKLNNVTNKLEQMNLVDPEYEREKEPALRQGLTNINWELEVRHRETKDIVFRQFILNVFEENSNESGLSWLSHNVNRLRRRVPVPSKETALETTEQLTFLLNELSKIISGDSTGGGLLMSDPVFEVLSPYKNEPLARDVLSFGQKSTILTELWLGCFEKISGMRMKYVRDEEKINQTLLVKHSPWQGASVENRYCLIIDEPEVGRSEYSVNKLISRLEESKELMDDLGNNTILVLSHRNKLLTQVSGQYHLLQPVDLEFQSEEE